ncbi:3-phosphoshikimate 1-carboxyvinyltransferase [Amycolatopsis alba]|uniref:3-phosphoshikimate 1-carboxyvinyltransferase n=1 Tax=Amycolatopsis alba DSM 44262 TaxID=1125972 RepID=A0A229RFF7_AMYAL|nr:3-phosphoshikimate 1-carboxyvinyltransferase [Amycolatopsis alba]OXM45191.1 3-phosphoshikimate 1-carboxyvinyltransferase [Amycolatopsis alba DSM 44262]
MPLFVTSTGAPLSGEVHIPSSKYHAHRALILASLAEGTSHIRGHSDARHVEFTRRLLRGLGTGIVSGADGVTVTGRGYRPRRDRLSVGSSGTTLYFMTGLAALADRPVTLVGQRYFQRRPIGPLLAALRSLGVRLESADDRPPITVFPGRPRGGTVRIPGLLSQWVSGLLLLAPFATGPTVIEVDGELNERPYLDLTLDLMAKFGLHVAASADRRRFEIEPGQTPRPADITLPPDLGSAAFGLAAAAIQESDVRFRGLSSADPDLVDHPESEFLGVLDGMGLTMEPDPAGGGLRVRHDGSPLAPFSVDCRDMPDMLPILATLATFADGTSTLRNLEHVRLKESDRVQAMLQLNRMGGRLQVEEDRLLVTGVAGLTGAELSSFNDHRVLMALAVAASRARGRTSIKNANAYRLSYPDFVRDLAGIGVPLSAGPADGPVPAAPEPDETTIVARVAELARRRPRDRALVEVRPDGERELSWAELDDQAARVAAFLRKLGVRTGDKVAYQLPNWSEFVVITLAVLRTGAICAPLMPLFRERELRQTLGRAGAKVLFIPGTFRGRDYRTEVRSVMTEDLAPGAGLPLEDVIVVSPPGGRPRFADDGVLRWHDFAKVIEETEPDKTASRCLPDRTAQLLFTSGTTGEPKGVLHRHRSLDLAAEAQIRRAALGDGDVVFVPSPLAHQTGFLYGMWLAIALGVPQVLQAEWEPALALDAIHRWKVTFVQAATPFLADLVEESGRGRGPRSGPRTFVVTGASVPRALAERARANWGTAVGGAWGTTETCLGTSFAPDDPPAGQWGTDGRAVDKVEIRVTGDDGRNLGPGVEGNFEVRGETMFEGYLDHPEWTAAAFTADGWFKTGDLAVIEDGYLRITGRVKDVINRGGEKVPVAEVEQMLHDHPSVAEGAVVAMPDDRLGERACAFVVLRPDSELSFAAMRKFLDSHRLAKTYWPERLEIIDSLPRNAIGKVQKTVLRDRARGLRPHDDKETSGETEDVLGR